MSDGLPLSLNQKLVDQADVAKAEKVVADIAVGREFVPADIVNCLLAGENKVRVWRAHRAMSARDLAAATGLSAPYTSEIESGKKEGSLSAMKKIAEALKVDLDDLA